MRGAVFGILAGTALAFSVAQPAAAVTIPGNSSISLSGSVIGTPAGSITNATSLDFTSEVGTPSVGTPGTLDGYGTGTGAFTGVSCLTGSCGSIKDIASLVTGPLSLTDFFILTGGTNSAAIHFDLASIDSITRPDPFL